MKTKNAGILLFTFLSILIVTIPLQAQANVAYVGTVDYDMDDVNDYTGSAATNSYLDNYIEQAIDGDGFSLSYNFYTWDGYDDPDEYDDPGFAIYVNDELVFSMKASDVSSDSYSSETLDSSGWIEFSYTFESTGTYTVTFYAGNTEDDAYQSWVLLTDLSPFSNGDFSTGDLTGWETSGQAGVVPIPGAVWLLGSGLLGMISIRKRK